MKDMSERCDYKPWPLEKQDNRNVLMDANRLRTRFNPRLVGFGIADHRPEVAECLQDRPETRLAIELTSEQNLKERK